MCSRVPALPLEAARSTLCSLFVGVQRRLVQGSTADPDCRHMTNIIFEVHRRWCRSEEVLVSVQSLLVPTRCPRARPLSVVVHAVHLRPVRGLVVASVRGTTVMTASLTFVSFTRCFRRASATASDGVVPWHSAMGAAIRRIWTGRESSPASFPTRSTSALAEDVVVVSEENRSDKAWILLALGQDS